MGFGVLAVDWISCGEHSWSSDKGRHDKDIHQVKQVGTSWRDMWHLGGAFEAWHFRRTLYINDSLDVQRGHDSFHVVKRYLLLKWSHLRAISCIVDVREYEVQSLVNMYDDVKKECYYICRMVVWRKKYLCWALWRGLECSMLIESLVVPLRRYPLSHDDIRIILNAISIWRCSMYGLMYVH